MEMEPQIVQEAEEIPPEETPDLEIIDLTEDSSLRSALPVAQDSGTGDGGKQRKEAREAKSGVPSAAEWQDFIGGTVLRLLTEGYLHVVLFREIDESDLSEREKELIRLDRDDLRDMAAPMAGFANKSKLARKHGRAIIAAGDSYESLIDLFIWMRRVNRIAKKYRKQKPTVIQGAVQDGEVPGANIAEDGTNQSPNAAGLINRGTG